jgi:hypothetical protein
MKIVRNSEFVRSVSYAHVFNWAEYGAERFRCGFGFDCDSEGEVLNLNPAAQKNYVACLTGAVDGKPVIDLGIERREHEYREPAIGRCDCGCNVTLDGFTNTCDCGADYNSAGQRLAPREQWGEETGETADDILRIG